jgi:peroxiredoxin
LTNRPGGSVDLNVYRKALILTLSAICLLGIGCNQDGDTLPKAPDFTLEDLSGNSVSLKQFRGQIVFLDFWATWCAPCRFSIPELVDLQKRYGDQGLVVLGISLDDPQMFNNAYLSEFKKQFKMNYRVLRATMKVAQDYFGTEPMAIPTLFVIDREGRIVAKHVGFEPGAAERSLKKLLS